jgi:hypothetical protein
MLWMALDADQMKTLLHQTAHLLAVFASPWQSTSALAAIPGIPQPTLSRASVTREASTMKILHGGTVPKRSR